MKDKRIKNRYIAKRYYKGRNALARWVDLVTSRLFAWAGLAVLLWRWSGALGASLCLSGALVGAWSLVFWRIGRKKREEFATKLLHTLRREGALERLLLLTPQEFEGEAGPALLALARIPEGELVAGGWLDQRASVFLRVIFNHPKASVNVQQVFQAARRGRSLGAEKVVLFSAAPLSPAAKELADRMEMSLLGREELIDHLPHLWPTPQEGEAILMDKARRDRPQRGALKRMAGPGRWKAYAVSALVLTLLPFVLGFSIWYPIFASASAALACISFAAGRQQTKTEGEL